jgi:drug/metabolite transporter (DMT)-like permease
MTAYLITLVILSWGIAGIFDKKALEHGSLRSVFLAFSLFNWPMILILLAVLSISHPGWHLSRGTIFWESVDSIASIAAISAYFYAMSKCEASYVLAITAGYPLVGALLSVPLLGEPFSYTLSAAAILVSLGLASVGFSQASEEKKKGTALERALVLACVLGSTTLWGLLGIFEKKSLQYGHPLESMLALSIGRALLVTTIVVLLSAAGRQLALTKPKIWQFSWSSAALVAVGNISYIAALASNPAGFMVVITSTYPLVMYVCALVFLKEKLNWLRAAGIVLVVAGAALTALA